MEYYELTLEAYRKLMENYSHSSYRREQEYADYLYRWFSDGFCDGITSYEQRKLNHLIPMSYNVYFN